MRPVDVAKHITRRRFSARTELHWVPGADDRMSGTRLPLQDHAVVERELGDRDWATIDPMMVRSSKGVKHQFTNAMYYWQRTGSHVWCESQNERWEALWLDYGGQVERLWAQPLAVAFGHGSRVFGHWHVPDFLAQFTDGTYGLFDARPANRIDDAARAQFDETAAICNTLGWRYRVLSGHDPLATRNLDCLSASRHDRCRPSSEIERLLLHAAQRGRTRRELCVLASPQCPPMACAWVDNLAWRRLLDLDLAAVFNSDTVYTTVNDVLEGVSG